MNPIPGGLVTEDKKMSAKETASLTRKRAAFAYNEVSSWGRTWREKAVIQAKGLPIALRTQGPQPHHGALD
ncbi:MAG: hypothetical protein C4B58_04425 [Deltaproteobacteria bacterium]|nr:MAG: hypothetical protein C4B58_04425 [Deltaproteobacteria bacterium]